MRKDHSGKFKMVQSYAAQNQSELAVAFEVMVKTGTAFSLMPVSDYRIFFVFHNVHHFRLNIHSPTLEICRPPQNRVKIGLILCSLILALPWMSTALCKNKRFVNVNIHSESEHWNLGVFWIERYKIHNNWL